MPLCWRHRFFQQQWTLLAWSVFGPLAVFAVWSALAIVFDGYRRTIGVVVATVLTAWVTGFVWLVVRSRRIRVAKISPVDIVLIGLAPEFIQACEGMNRKAAKPVQDYLDGLK